MKFYVILDHPITTIMKLPNSVYNWTTVLGSIIAAISLFMILFFFGISLFWNTETSYLGLLTYIVLPAFLVLGLLLIPIGMWIKVRRDRKKETSKPTGWPVIDLNSSRHRNAFIIFTITTTLFLFLSAIGSYEAFHYTESVKFCGTLCHKVMEPEYTAYQNSPHARVACVDCHVGSGASWYVKSKLSGLYQVYSVTFHKYPQPIPSPIKNLRPARETCEECHWPQKFYAHKIFTEKRFLADSLNSEWDISLKMKIGAAYSPMGLQEGIHWHINPDVKIEYIALTPQRDELPWVRLTNLKTGEVRVYQNEESPLSPGQMDSLETRIMDCMDCHNRPSHDYKSPPRFFDYAMTAGEIPHELLQVKKIGMDVLNRVYPTRDTALLTIENEVNAFYKEKFPDLYVKQAALVQQSITGMKNQFGMNIFPYMKVRWDAYPNHIGHLEFNGCFRCHNNKHRTEDGHVISKDCNLCHTINAQGNPHKLQVTSINDSLQFIHPVNIEDAWKEYMCTECHAYLY
jgi:hypothetical protein